jgi:hypothetical protein
MCSMYVCKNNFFNKMFISLITDRLHNTWKETTEQRGSTMELNSASWFHTHRFAFTTPTFISPVESSYPATQENLWHVACPNPLFSHLFLSTKTVCALPHKSVQSSPYHQRLAFFYSWRHLLSLSLKCFWRGIQARQSSKSTVYL